MIIIPLPEPIAWIANDNVAMPAAYRFRPVPATSWYNPRDEP